MSTSFILAWIYGKCLENRIANCERILYRHKFMEMNKSCCNMQIYILLWLSGVQKRVISFEKELLGNCANYNKYDEHDRL